MVFATVIEKLQGYVVDDLARIMEAIFECTPRLIIVNFEDDPEHRIRFLSSCEPSTRTRLPPSSALVDIRNAPAQEILQPKQVQRCWNGIWQTCRNRDCMSTHMDRIYDDETSNIESLS